nr:uncharacterized protein LOC107437359 [Parasteatoda tepidariorum]
MFSVLLGLFIAICLGLSLFLILLLFVNPKKFTKTINETTVVIVKFVELHRESLPLNSANGWSLTPSHCSLRCWQKEFSIELLGAPVSTYACVKEIPCAAVILLNVIADVSTWSEWDIQAPAQSINLELPENPSLHFDPYMQCDQVVLTSSKLKAKPEVEMYRFGNLESNGTGWILLWNAKQLDWTLYIAQPIDNCSGNDENACVLTVIWGCEPLQHNMPESLCKKILSLSEAISWSQLKVRPFQSLINTSSLNNPHFPSIHTALNDLPRKPCVLLEHEDRPMSFQNGALAVIAASSEKPVTVKNLTGFTLMLFPFKKSNNNNVINCETLTEDKRKSRRRLKLRSDSMTSNAPRKKYLEIENRRSSSLTTPIRKRAPELTVTQPDDEGVPPKRAVSHSFLNVLFQQRRSSDSSYQRSRSPSPCSPTKQKKKGFFIFEKRSSLSSQEELFGGSYRDLDVSDANDEDKFLRKAYDMESENDFKALGEFSISAVLEENLRASLVDINAPEEEQKRASGGWVCKEVNKSLAVFKKTTHFESCVFVSYLCKGIIPTSFEAVWKTLCNPLTRFMYDDTVKKITVLGEYSGGQKLIHMYNESVSLLRKEVQDFCVLQTEKKQGSQFILGFHSVKDDVCPPIRDVVRGTVSDLSHFFFGEVLKKCGENIS